MRIRTNTQNAYQNRHKREILYPVEHLSLLSSDYSMKVATFQSARTQRNKRLCMSVKTKTG